jgi:heme exporter protein A
MLQAIDLSCVRGERRLFRALSFNVGAGEILQVRGDNGAGKTSLLRMLAGLSPPASGTVRWRGAARHRIGEEYLGELAYIGHSNALKEDLTPVENLLAALTLAGVASDVRQVRACLEAEGLDDAVGLPVQWLSQGQKRRVALARLALCQSRPLWILDEPFSALDRSAVQRLCSRIDSQASRGGVVVLTTHQEVRFAAPAHSLELP